MTYAGADSETKAEMGKVLHLPSNQAVCGAAFQSLAAQLAKVVSDSARHVAEMRRQDGDATPIELNVANRLFVQRGYCLGSAFVEDLHRYFGSDLTELDFKRDPAQARKMINRWIAGQTQDKILDLLPAGQPTTETRFALVNALDLPAGWSAEFRASATQPEPFHFIGRAAARAPTMLAHR